MLLPGPYSGCFSSKLLVRRIYGEHAECGAVEFDAMEFGVKKSNAMKFDFMKSSAVLSKLDLIQIVTQTESPSRAKRSGQLRAISAICADPTR